MFSLSITKEGILWGVIAVLLVVAACLAYRLFVPIPGPGSMYVGGGAAPSAELDFSVGGGLSYAIGTIERIDGAELVVSTPEGAVSVRTDAATKVTTQGALKSADDFQKDIAAYNARIAELLEDPVENREALLRLEMPLPFLTVEGALSDLEVGQDVVVASAEGTARSVHLR